jgi:hypothetical protein
MEKEFGPEAFVEGAATGGTEERCGVPGSPQGAEGASGGRGSMSTLAGRNKR